MSDNTDGYNPTKEQQQNMDNLSFDRKYLVNSVESLVESNDGTSTAGTVIWTSGSMSNQTVPFTVPFNTGIQFVNGLYLSITAANCNCLVMYE